MLVTVTLKTSTSPRKVPTFSFMSKKSTREFKKSFDFTFNFTEQS